MMYKQIAWYDCEEDERFTVDKMYIETDNDYVYTPFGTFVNDVNINGVQCELYEENGYYTAYVAVDEEDDTYGEMIDRRYQEYVDSKYEN